MTDTRTFLISATELAANGVRQGIGGAIEWAEAQIDPDTHDIVDVSATPKGKRYAVAWEVSFEVVPVHTIGGERIGPDNPGEYGRTHDLSCPACEGTSFSASPRSEAYWCA